MPLPLTETEVLEKCLSECRRRLEQFRDDRNELQADLAEADMNQMLDQWQRLRRAQDAHHSAH